MAYIEDRKHKDGSVTYYGRWIDPDTKQRAPAFSLSSTSTRVISVTRAERLVNSQLTSVTAEYLGAAAELRDDVTNATLVAILQDQGTELERQSSSAGQRGCKSLQATSEAVAALRA